MNPTSSCPICHQPLPDSSTLGTLCPQCLLRSGFYSGTAPEPGPSERFAAPSIADLAPLFPQLEILELIGRGGMGAVYKARQPNLNRIIALKVLAGGQDGDTRFAERFQREAQALARMNHPNIVTVYDFGEASGYFYLLMEFVDGMNLRELESSRRLSPAEALAIVPSICDALQYAHGLGIVHRDIKPENILLDKSGKVKIADFGIAKLMGGDNARPLTDDQQRVGTPHYMAPEQVERPAAVDHRADIYSLGVVFYEMLTGELPLGRFASPSKKVQIDVRLDQIVMRALEKEPELRFQQVSEIKTGVETLSNLPAENDAVAQLPYKRNKWVLIVSLIPILFMLIIGHRIVQEKSLIWWNFGFGVAMFTVLVRFLTYPDTKPNGPAASPGIKVSSLFWQVFAMMVAVTAIWPDLIPSIWGSLPNDAFRLGLLTAALAIFIAVALLRASSSRKNLSSLMWTVFAILVALAFIFPALSQEMRRLTIGTPKPVESKKAPAAADRPNTTFGQAGNQSVPGFPDQPAVIYDSGVRARLVGIAPTIRSLPAWNVDGTSISLTDPAYNTLGLNRDSFSANLQPGEMGRKFQVVVDHLGGANGNSGIEWKVSGGRTSTATSEQSANVIYASFDSVFPDKETQTTFSLRLAAGLWKTVVESDLHDFALATASSSHSGQPTTDINAIYDGQTEGVYRYNISDNLQDSIIRLTAIDQKGTEVVFNCLKTQGSEKIRQSLYELKANDLVFPIAKVKLQSRTYQWLDFPNVPLMPESTN